MKKILLLAILSLILVLTLNAKTLLFVCELYPPYLYVFKHHVGKRLNNFKMHTLIINLLPLYLAFNKKTNISTLFIAFNTLLNKFSKTRKYSELMKK